MTEIERTPKTDINLRFKLGKKVLFLGNHDMAK